MAEDTKKTAPDADAGRPAGPEAREEARRQQDAFAEKIGLPLLKELTDALLTLSREVHDLREAIEGAPAAKEGDEEEPGLVDIMDELRDVVASLDVHQVGMNIHLARFSYIMDRVVEVSAGDPNTQPPVEGRVPTLKDIVDAAAEYDKKLEEEVKEDEEREKREGEAETSATAPPAAAKPAMMTNGRALPPLPVAAPRPSPSSAPARLRVLPPLPVAKPK